MIVQSGKLQKPLQSRAGSRILPNEKPHPLWVCVHLPNLALEIHASGTSPIRAVVDGHDRLCAVSASARTAGIEKGMSTRAALALSKVLQLLPRDTRRELAVLRNVGRACCRLTPTVSLAPPDAVLLEVRGSLRLFGGFAGLRKALEDGLAPLGPSYHWAAAPTPEASLLLARYRPALTAENRGQLRAFLGEVPIEGLDIDARLRARLRQTGLRQLRDLWRLPRDGLARRYGLELTMQLDRLLGDRPDLRASYRPPPEFRSQLELPATTSESALISVAAGKLFRKLAQFLRRWDVGTTAVCVRLFHRHALLAPIHIGTRHNTRDPAHLLRLFDQALQRYRLSEPVTRLEMFSIEIQPFVPFHQDVFHNGAEETQDWQQTVEELMARLGAQAIRQIHLMDDHRPESAWAYQGRGFGQAKQRQRPVWLLPQPLRLVWRNRHLWYHGLLTLCGGPERIESGWWDERGCRRDYYIAVNSEGRKLWIFKDLKQLPDTWYLHGLFG